MKSCLTLLLAMILALPAQASTDLKPFTPRPAPALDLPALDGSHLDLAKLRGRVVLVNFWAVWCPPCRKEMPSLTRLADRLAGRPFTVLGVNVGDSADSIRAFLGQVPANLPILLDAEGASVKPWQVFAFPTTYLVDKKGQLRQGLFGAIDWDEPNAVAHMEALLAEPDPPSPDAATGEAKSTARAESSASGK